ncbi:MAG: transcriptional coactivator p15/PC4 family protein [Candidatus Omnitrophica bacterium]|nr:transcriptional coactivator p15/PC4 family protein [Candidatus Omnitrophota bacterium]
MEPIRDFLFTFPYHENDQVRLSAGYYKSKLYLDLRIFFRHRESNEFRPTKKGITLSSEFLPELKRALEYAEQALAQPGASATE